MTTSRPPGSIARVCRYARIWAIRPRHHGYCITWAMWRCTAATAPRQPRIFARASASFSSSAWPAGSPKILAGLAAVAASSGQAAEAARLWGAAEALHETVGTPVWPSDRRERLRYQPIARAQLDPASWQAAWQEGRANPLVSD